MMNVDEGGDDDGYDDDDDDDDGQDKNYDEEEHIWEEGMLASPWSFLFSRNGLMPSSFASQL